MFYGDAEITGTKTFKSRDPIHPYLLQLFSQLSALYEVDNTGEENENKERIQEAQQPSSAENKDEMADMQPEEEEEKEK